MEPLSLLEARRLKLQVELDSVKSKAERNRLGQFATPSLLATSILEKARQFLTPHEPIRFLDPALGTGAFYSALLRAFPNDQLVIARGYEIDPHYGQPTRLLWSEHQAEIIIADFTKAVPPDRDADKFNLVICNPPYVRHHHLPIHEKKRLQAKVAQITQVEFSGLAGLYTYFLGVAHAWLQDGGIAGWLIPSEFMDVNYGSALRQYLTSQVTLLDIHRFAPKEVQFDDALVSSVVVWFRKQRPQPEDEVCFSVGGNINTPHFHQKIRVAALRQEKKWTRFPNQTTSSPGNLVLRIRDLFEIKRGVATGANSFFIIDAEQVYKYDLPVEFLTPILPSPRYLDGDEVFADVNGNPILKRPLFLVDCDLPEDQVAQHYPKLWRYFQLGVEQGIHNGYLCQHRSPWYAQDKRAPSPFLCTYMGRSSNGHVANPFRFILNHSQAIAPNVYLNLYPKGLLTAALAEKPQRKFAVWRALQAITAEKIIGEGRVYGGGLYKLEPNELGNLSISEVSSWDEFLSMLPRQETLF